MIPSKLSQEYFLLKRASLEVLEQDPLSPAIRTQTRITKILSFIFLPSFLACPSRPGGVLSFVGEKPFFSPESASVTAQPAVASDDPMTGNDDGYGIPVVGLPDRPPGLRPSHRTRHLAITRGRPIRDPDKLLPGFFLKLRTLKVEGRRKFLPLPAEIFVDLLDRRPERAVPPGCAGRPATDKIHARDALSGPDYFDDSDRIKIISAVFRHHRQYRQLVRSAPGAADFSILAMILGMCFCGRRRRGMG